MRTQYLFLASDSMLEVPVPRRLGHHDGWGIRKKARENGRKNRFLSRVRSAAKRECEQ